MDLRVRRAVLDRLAAVEEIAARAGATLSAPLAPLARKHIQTITDGWRELLVQHQPDSTGRCPVCSGWLRRRRWPCEVWSTAHLHLIGDGTEQIDRSVRNSNPFCRPRQVLVVPRQLDAAIAEQTRARKASMHGAAGKASIHQG
ncbi:MAG: hypothetical protein M3Y73_11320 [Actinomycetota bacterium]|nr:hypothetical protein [Actinomycetota bacterium]